MRLLKDESILNKKDKIYCSLVKANNNPNYKDFTKLNFLVDYVTQQFNTKIYIDQVDQNIKTINDLEQLPLYMSNVRFIVKITKLWYNNNMYGLKLGILQMQIKPNETKKENKYDEYAFD